MLTTYVRYIKNLGGSVTFDSLIRSSKMSVILLCSASAPRENLNIQAHTHEEAVKQYNNIPYTLTSQNE